MSSVPVSQTTTKTTEVTSAPTTTSAANTQVLVQSTVASETQTSTETVRTSNLSSLLDRLTTTHSQMSAFAASRQGEIDEWGKAEIAKILQGTQVQQEMLLKSAEARSLTLDDKFKKQLQDWVQQMDLKKAEELKALENSLHAQQETVLTQAKAQIHQIENEVNRRKMDVLKQAQLSGAGEIDQLSNLVSVAKLRPHTTTTVITTNTETGTVVAAAGPGPAIQSGAATASAISSTGGVIERRDGVLAHDHTEQHGTFRTENTVGVADVMTSTTAVLEKSEVLSNDKTTTSSRVTGTEPRTSARV